MILLPAFGLGSLIGSPCWGQADPVTAAPSKPPLIAPASDQGAPTLAILTPPAPTGATSSAATATSTSPDSASTAANEVGKMVVEIEQLGSKLALLTKDQKEKWEEATAALPGFCEDWDRMLHDREINNLSHLQWQEKQGYETATYTGYGKVQDCQAKESDEGVPIGKVTYQEVSYYLSGKSIDDAKAHPQVVGKTSTLEIFSWEKDRWFY
jgi:hypothetical protein